MQRYGTIDRELAMKMATWPEDTDGPVLMVNLMKYRERADYGAVADGESVSGREADDRYSPVEVLGRIGAEVAYFADVEGVEGDASVVWDRVGIVLYPTRKSFIDMQARQDFKEKRVHKDAGMEFTIVMPCVPEAGHTNGDADRAVRSIVVWPAGTTPTIEADATVGVEGTIMGDQRRWGHLTLHAAGPEGDVAEGAIVVRLASPSIDRLLQIVAAWAR